MDKLRGRQRRELGSGGGGLYNTGFQYLKMKGESPYLRPSSLYNAKPPDIIISVTVTP